MAFCNKTDATSKPLIRSKAAKIWSSLQTRFSLARKVDTENLWSPVAWCTPRASGKCPSSRTWFRARDYRLIELDYGSDYLEGHGDLLWHPDGSCIYGGYGFRSTRGGIEKFATAMAEMGIPVVPLQLVDPYCYHLDTCLCPLNNESALIFPGAYSTEALASLHKFWKRVHLLTAEEAHSFMGNGIVVNGTYITSHMTPQLEVMLHQEGLTPVIVDTSEFEKSGGSCFCMKTFLP